MFGNRNFLVLNANMNSLILIPVFHSNFLNI
jgi:hypothetical protein